LKSGFLSGFTAGFVCVGLVTFVGLVTVVGLVTCVEGRVTFLSEVGFVTVVLGLVTVVLPGLRSVVVLTAGREADLTPELLDTDLEPDSDLVDLDTEVEVDLDVLEPLPVLLACAMASD
jgi:hypothetical protein